MPGGYYATIIGDTRQQGKYVSYQAEFIARMPSNELASVLIKAQHNTQSGGRTYAAMKLPRIEHEYILLWAKPRAIMSMLQTLAVSAEQQQQRVKSTWRAIVRQAMVELGGTSDLTTLYQRVSSAKPEQLRSNQNWMAKIRQTLQLGPFISSERGVWAIA